MDDLGMKRLDLAIFSYRKTKELIKSNESLKARFLKGHVLFIPFMIAVIMVLGISGVFNIFFFTLSAIKITIIYSLIFSAIYFLTANRETAENWHDRSTRNENIVGKILLSIKDGIILLVISFIVFIIVLLTGFPQKMEQSYLEENVGIAYPFSYIPSTIEAILFALIILLSLISIFTSIYWFYSRGIVITGYLPEKKIMKPETNRFLLSWFGNILIWISFIFLDGIFLDVKYPDFSTRYLSLKGIFVGKDYFILLIQLAILLILNAFYITDGIIANKRRTNFSVAWVIDSQEPIVQELTSQEINPQELSLEMKNNSIDTKKDNFILASYKQTRTIIRSDEKLKLQVINNRFMLLLLHILFIIIFSMIMVSFNIFFFIISFLKYLILYCLSMSTIYLLMVDRQTAENWQDRSNRNKNLKGKFLHLAIDGSLLFVVSLLVLGIMYLTGTTRKMDDVEISLGSGGILTRTYIPHSIEAILIGSLITILLLSIFTTIFWFYNRCMVITSYSTKKKMMNAEPKRMIFCLVINWIIWGILLPILLDLAFLNVKFPWNFPVHFLFEKAFEQNPYYILLIQLVVIILLNLFYIIDGIVANRKTRKKINCHEFY